MGERSTKLSFDLGGVLGASGGDVSADVALAQGLQVLLAQITAVGRGFLGFTAEGVVDRIDERHELAVVAHARSQLMGYDDLGRPIDGSLGVEAWM